tara:strand:+ start:1558 stop:1806 length:249 start_codon:yes stop_codon:yes gene_type:complete
MIDKDSVIKTCHGCGLQFSGSNDKRHRSRFSLHLNACKEYKAAVQAKKDEEAEDEETYKHNRLTGAGFTDDQASLLLDMFAG